MGKHARHISPDVRLTFEGIVFRSTQTDEEMITLLRGLRFVYSPLVGMCGGPLARLRRDIHDGHTTLPGRARYESLELVATAYQRVMEAHRRSAPEIRKMERELWWITNRLSVALIAIILLIFTALAIFFDDLINAVSAAAPSSSAQADVPEAVLHIAEVGATYVLPILVVLIVMALLTCLTWFSVFRR